MNKVLSISLISSLIILVFCGAASQQASANTVVTFGNGFEKICYYAKKVPAYCKTFPFISHPKKLPPPPPPCVPSKYVHCVVVPPVTPPSTPPPSKSVFTCWFEGHKGGGTFYKCGFQKPRKEIHYYLHS